MQNNAFRPNILGEKNKNKTRELVFENDMKNSCATFQGPSLENGVDILTFVRKKRENKAVPSSTKSIFVDIICSILNIRRSGIRFCFARKNVQTCLLGSKNRTIPKKRVKIVYFLWKRLPTTDY